MKGAICRGVLKEEVTKQELWVDGKLIVIEDVPVFSLKALKATG